MMEYYNWAHIQAHSALNFQQFKEPIQESGSQWCCTVPDRAGLQHFPQPTSENNLLEEELSCLNCNQH